MNLRDVGQQIRRASSIVYFGGAGTSTESNIPDFRTDQGLYQKKSFTGRTPEELLSATTLSREPEVFFRYYRTHMVYPDARPNKAHRTLARWEKNGKVKAVITQNIDGLHQMAGSKEVLELHGSVHRNYCTQCSATAGVDEVMNLDEKVPQCRACGGMLRPDVVLYGEGLDLRVVEQSIHHLQKADLLIIGGTSLVVYPAAGLIKHYQGSEIILINRDPTPYDHRASWVIRDSIGDVLRGIDKELESLDVLERAEEHK